MNYQSSLSTPAPSWPNDFAQLCQGLARREAQAQRWLHACAQRVLQELAERLLARGALVASEVPMFVPYALVWARQRLLEYQRQGKRLSQTGKELAPAVERLVAVAVARHFGSPNSIEWPASQKRPLQGSLPLANGYAATWLDWPARGVSGDFWITGDCENQSWILLGDVCGKGGLAHCVAETLRLLAPQIGRSQGAAPRSFLQKIHEELIAILPEDLFVTAVVAVCNRAGGAIASAAMSPVIVRRSLAGAEFVELEGPLLGIGKVDESMFGEQTVRLAPGDELLLFSDGVLDQATPVGRFSAEIPTLGRNLPPDVRFFDQIQIALTGYKASHGQFDDISLLSVQQQALPEIPVCEACPERVCPALVERVGLADPLATAELTATLRQELEPALKQMLSDPNDIDDVLQAAFARLFAKLAFWGRECPLCLYFRVIATREALDVLRRRKKRRAQQENWDEIETTIPAAASGPVTAPSNNDLESWLATVPLEVADCLRMKLQAASPRAKEILSSRVRDVSRAEIAAELKISRQAVNAHLRKLEVWLGDCFRK